MCAILCTQPGFPRPNSRVHTYVHFHVYTHTHVCKGRTGAGFGAQLCVMQPGQPWYTQVWFGVYVHLPVPSGVPRNPCQYVGPCKPLASALLREGPHAPSAPASPVLPWKARRRSVCQESHGAPAKGPRGQLVPTPAWASASLSQAGRRVCEGTLGRHRTAFGDPVVGPRRPQRESPATDSPPSLGLSPSWAAHGCSVKRSLMWTLCRENPLLICELRFP